MNPSSLFSTTELGLATLRAMGDHVLVFCRLLGLLILIPGINVPALGWQLRGLLLVTVAAIIAPNVSPHVREVLEQGQIQQVAHSDSEMAGGNWLRPESITNRTDASASSVDRSLMEWMHLGLAELCLGLMLGLGANLVLQSFRMAGVLIEQQTGLPLGATVAAENDEGGTGHGDLLFWLGCVLFLIAGGHLVCISTLLDTFRHFPVGYGSVSSEFETVATGLVQNSLKLALQLSAPVIATQILVNGMLSHAGNSAPQFSGPGLANPIRIVSAGMILSLTLNGFTERILEAIPWQ